MAADLQDATNAKVVQALARADLNADTRVHVSATAQADDNSAPNETAAPLAYPLDGNTRVKASFPKSLITIYPSQLTLVASHEQPYPCHILADISCWATNLG